MAIDKIDWHRDAITDEISDDENWEKAGAHIGYFIEWAYKKGFAPSNPETNDVDECEKVINSEINGVQFLIENCDSKFWEEDLNEQGQKFAEFAYDVYLQNFETIVGHKPYTTMYNQQDLKNVSKYLDKVYLGYLENPPLKLAGKDRQTLFQRLKGMFLK